MVVVVVVFIIIIIIIIINFHGLGLLACYHQLYR
jgi:hypothetical protein